MRKCPKCGKTYDDSWKVCLQCNVALVDDLSMTNTNPEPLKNEGAIKKSRFVENMTDADKMLLRLKRKEVMGYFLFFLVFYLVPIAMLKMVANKSLTIMHILAGIVFISVIVAFILGVKSLNKLTKMIYTEPAEFFIAYLLAIVLGSFFMGFFAIIGLISLWSEVNKVLATRVI